MFALEDDQLKELISALQLAYKVGYKSTSSPVVPLLEAGTDICLLLKTLFEEGSQARQNNPELRFSKTQVDVLNNPLQIRVRKTPKVFWDPQVATFFTHLASFFSLLKQDSRKAMVFMTKAIEVLQPPIISEKERNREVEKAKRECVRAFHRRQRQRASRYSQIKAKKKREPVNLSRKEIQG